MEINLLKKNNLLNIDFYNLSKNFDNFSKKKKYIILSKYPELFQFINKKYRNDTNLVFCVVKKNGYLLQFADLKLRDNYKIVKEAVKNFGFSIQFASERLRDNKT